MPPRSPRHLWLLLERLRGMTHDPRCWLCDERADGARVYFRAWQRAAAVPACEDHQTGLILAA